MLVTERKNNRIQVSIIFYKNGMTERDTGGQAI